MDNEKAVAQSFFKGTVILAVAAFVARFLGLVQRVPLQNLLGDTGMATYGIAYNVYAALLIIATAGIPSALSKLVSERTALGRHREASDIYRASIQFAIMAGFIMTVLLLIAAPYYAIYVTKDPEAVLAIRALAPALLIFPLIAVMRGYYQGRQMMMAQGVSQIIEQLLRVGTAIFLAFLFVRLGYERETVAAGASFGGVMGAIGALFVMIWFWRKYRSRDLPLLLQEQFHYKQSNKAIYARLFKLSIPISIYSMTVPMIYFIDSSLTIGLLEGQIGFDEAKEALGLLAGRAQAFAGIAPILAIAISQSIIPMISSSYARRDMEQVQSQSSLAIKVSLIASIPIILVLCSGASSFNRLLFSDSNGTGIIMFLVASALFQVLVMTTGAILLGLNRQRTTMKFVITGLIVKLIMSLLLAAWFGIYGIIAATMLSFIAILCLNLLLLRRIVRIAIYSWMRWVLLALMIVGLTILGVLMHELLMLIIATPWHLFNDFVIIVILGSLLMVAYVWLLIKWRLITEQDMENIPARLRNMVARITRLIQRK